MTASQGGVALIPGDLRAFYQSRRLLIALACIAPLALLGGAWWLVNRFVLAPATPDPRTSGDEVVRFVIDPRGLPRLDSQQSHAFLEQHMRRWSADAAYRESFVTSLRRATGEEQSAFRTHLFDVIKPIVMADVQRFHELRDKARAAYVDQKIVEYNRMASLMRTTARPDKAALGEALPQPQEMMGLLLSRTTDQERAQGTAFFTAMGTRIVEILADPAQKAQFEARIAAP